MTTKKVKIAPLPNSFFFMSIVGFYISVIYVAKKWPDFGVAFALVFAIMFFASVISFTYAPAKSLIKMDEYEQTHKGLQILSYKEYRKEEKLRHKEEKKAKRAMKKSHKQKN